MYEPTKEQKAILDEKSNCVVIAAPGSGKTHVLSEKIKLILEDLPIYRGVIAISFTNKASNELKSRVLQGKVESKNSFFGTIDKFCLVEVIIAFGKQIFGLSKQTFQVIELKKLDRLDNETKNILNSFSAVNSDKITKKQIQVIKTLFVEDGIIILDFFGIIANYILDNSVACQKYLQAKYSYIIIDEYQDSDFEQNKFFLKLVELRLIGIAVGDIRQAIFAFAGKKSVFLRDLTQEKDFTYLPLTFNFRCHPSISNYSKLFLQSGLEGFKANLRDVKEIRVFEKKVFGNEIIITNWIDSVIPILKERFNIIENSKIGILVKSNLSGERVNQNLKIPNRLITTNILDNDVSLWSNLFTKLLSFGYSDKQTPFELLMEFYDIYENKKLNQVLLPILREFKILLSKFDYENEQRELDLLVSKFINIGTEILNSETDFQSIELLKKTLQNKNILLSYLPSKNNEVQILTLFKAKGLEFDVVFHLDLYSFILPQRKKKDGSWNHFSNLEQDFNLHYVGLTRAKECCFLLHSSKRQTNSGEREANSSEFLNWDESLKNHRILIKNKIR